MVDFWIYDVIFMALFTGAVTYFIKTRKRGLSREGWIFMYRSQAGIRAINYVGDNFKKTLDLLKIPIIGVGVFLMGIMIWMLGQTVWIYISRPEITDIIKAPPIAPLIPYFPKLFGMESFFPPFYFTYFILALAVVAIVHEFSHGIFMKRFKIKIKSTGLVFLGPILGAFVEEERKNFESKNNVEQMAVLGAGVFANIIFAFIFYGLYVLFFFVAFSASGYIFTNYAAVEVPVNSIDSFGEDLGRKMVVISGTSGMANLTEVFIKNETFIMLTLTKEVILGNIDLPKPDKIAVFLKTPAIESGMKGAIIQGDNVKINSGDDLRVFLQNKEPGDLVKFITETEEGQNTYDVVLGSRPDDSGKAYLGVGHSGLSPRGIVQGTLAKFMSFKDYSTNYKPNWNADFVYFFYDLLWWIMIINFLVALFNMLPLGILDGGRFFYLGILSITGSETLAKKSYKAATYLIGFIFLFLVLIWLFRII